MVAGNRRKIEELFQLYTLHPEMRDVFVEGARDKGFLDWFLNRSQPNNALVYEISTVDIPSAILEEHELKPGSNKHRVIALALELESLDKSDVLDSATCVIDRDYDLFFDKPCQPCLLLSTDYSCLDMYSFNDKCLHKFFTLFAGGISQPLQQLLPQLSRVLERLFLIRLTNEQMNLGLTWIQFGRSCSLNGSEIGFDEDAFIQKYLNSSGQSDNEEDFRNKMELLKGKLPVDSRLKMHGHDYVTLVSWYLKELRKEQSIYNPKAVERALWTSIEYEDIVKEAFARSLLARVGP